MSKNRDDIDRFHEYGINFTTRTIFLGLDQSDDDGHISPALTEQVIKNLMLLDSASKEEVKIIFNTPGGDVSNGMAMYDAVSNMKAYVTGIVYKAESMGALIIQACDRRLIMPHGSFMLHKGNLGFSEAHTNTVYKWVEESKREDRVYEDLLLKRIKEKNPRFTKQELLKIMEHDTWLSPTQTIKIGLMDEIIGK